MREEIAPMPQHAFIWDLSAMAISLSLFSGPEAPSKSVEAKPDEPSF